jgi:hypothetical protein
LPVEDSVGKGSHRHLRDYSQRYLETHTEPGLYISTMHQKNPENSKNKTLKTFFATGGYILYIWLWAIHQKYLL